MKGLERVHFILSPGTAFPLVGTGVRVHSPVMRLGRYRRVHFFKPCVGTVDGVEMHFGRYGYAEDDLCTAYRWV